MIIELLLKIFSPAILTLIYINNNYDFIVRSLERAEITLNSYEWENLE